MLKDSGLFKHDPHPVEETLQGFSGGWETLFFRWIEAFTTSLSKWLFQPLRGRRRSFITPWMVVSPLLIMDWFMNLRSRSAPQRPFGLWHFEKGGNLPMWIPIPMSLWMMLHVSRLNPQDGLRIGGATVRSMVRMEPVMVRCLQITKWTREWSIKPWRASVYGMRYWIFPVFPS